MDFAQVVAEFHKLKGRFEAGDLTEAEFQAQLQDLMVQDEQGRWWMIGYETGQWYVHNGEQWVRGEPPGIELASVEATPTQVQVEQPALAVERAVPPGKSAWWPLLLVMAGWGLCFWIISEVDFWTFRSPSHPSLSLAWFLAGLATALAIKWSAPAIRWEYVLIMSFTWGIGWLLISAGAPDDTLLIGIGAIVFLCGFGVACGVGLWQAGLAVQWYHVLAVIGIWVISIGAGIFILVPQAWPHAGAYPGDPLRSALIGNLVGAVGGGVTLWLVRRARAVQPVGLGIGQSKGQQRILAPWGIKLHWIGAGFTLLALLGIIAVAWVRQGELSGRYAPTAKPVAELPGAHAAFSPDGKWVVTAGGEVTTTAQVWESNTWGKVIELRGHTDRVNDAEFSSDGKWIVTASDDKTARVWEASTGNSLTELRGHTGKVKNASFSPDGEWVVTVSDDKTARVWETTTGRSLSGDSEYDAPADYARFSPDGKWLVTSSPYQSRVREADTGKLVATLINGHAQFSADSNMVITAGGWDGEWRLWRIPDGMPWGHGRINDLPMNAALSPDGKLVAIPTLNYYMVQVWEANYSARGPLIMRGHTNRIWSAAFSPNSKFVVTASDDGTARVWDAKTGRSVLVLRGHKNGVFNAVFSPDGKWVLTTGGDGMARVWDAGP